jgi:hypothetical protein
MTTGSDAHVNILRICANARSSGRLDAKLNCGNGCRTVGNEVRVSFGAHSVQLIPRLDTWGGPHRSNKINWTFCTPTGIKCKADGTAYHQPSGFFLLWWDKPHIDLRAKYGRKLHHYDCGVEYSPMAVALPPSAVRSDFRHAGSSELRITTFRSQAAPALTSHFRKPKGAGL